MNKLKNINSQAELEQLIEHYFEGNTSLQEERVLRQTLVDCPWSSEAIDEARFTMGYFTAHKHQRRKATTASNRYLIPGIAASIALLLTVGAGLLWHNQQPENVCVAYVNGKTIHNEQEIYNLIQNDLDEMGNAAQSPEEQLSSLGADIEFDI